MQLMAMLSQSSPQQIRIAREVFATMVSLEVDPVNTPWNLGETGTVVSAIYFSKSWDGVLFVECAKPLAFVLTERMMAVERPADVDDNVRDTIGELANMIGGNFKAVMPPETRLSVPAIFEHGPHLPNLPDHAGSRLLTSIVLEGWFGKCRLSLLANSD